MLNRKIRIHPAEGTWVVRAGGAVLAESVRALELEEGDLPTVIYFPTDDIGMAFLDTSATRSSHPLLGPALHYDIAAKSGPIRDAAWTFEAPPEEAGRIAGHVAFGHDEVTVEQV